MPHLLLASSPTNPGTLSRVNFPGGFIKDDSVYHCIHDNQEEFLTHGGLHLSLHGARMYDPALLRFITPDPLGHETPYLYSYLYCAANPVMYIDPSGKKITQKIDGITYYYRKVEDKWGFYDGLGTPYTGSGSVAGNLDKIRNADPILDRMITSIAENETVVRITLTSGDNTAGPRYNGNDEITAYVIEYNPECTTGGRAKDPDGRTSDYRSPEAGLAHELGHTFEWLYPILSSLNSLHLNLQTHEDERCHNESVSCIIENIYMSANGEPLRVSYFKSDDPESFNSNNTDLNFSRFDRIFMRYLSIIISENH